MQYTTLGRTGLKVSVAGLGAGGGSQLGLDRGRSKSDAVALVRLALDLGVNVIDTAETYLTLDAIGEALRGVDRGSVVLSAKHHLSPYRDPRNLYPAAQIVEGLDNLLRQLGTDHVDVFHLHALTLPRFDHAIAEVVPALLREREKGKFRFLGATEAPTQELQHQALQKALDLDLFDVVMVGFQMFHQNARELVFPKTRARNVGTMLMFVVRNIFADPAHLRATVQRLAAEGLVPRELAARDNPLDFLLHPGGAGDLVEAAYRYARHEPGADIVLFGTGDPQHLRRNVAAITAPPLPEQDRAQIRTLFGHLVGVGLDIPGRIPPSVRSGKP
jgi:aryl-alcohol dehydrogenase-like predicted oxidoreductase